MNLLSQNDHAGYYQPQQQQQQQQQRAQRMRSPQPVLKQSVLKVRQQPADTHQHQPIACTRNPDEFSVAESALLLGAFVALVTSILSFTAL